MSSTIHWTECLTRSLRRAADPARLLIACDFDGTLAPIVPAPADAALLPGMEAVLRRLSTAPGVHLAFVSGRPLADLRQRVPILRASFIGSHGMEMQGHGMDGLPAAAAPWRARFPLIADAIRRRTAHMHGVFVEEKPLSVAVHYRHAAAADSAAVMSLLKATAENARELFLQEGHKVIELLPAIHCNKGTALCALTDRLGLPRSAVLCCGDDLTDETMFTALPNALSIHIGTGPTAASCRADSPADLLLLLQHVDAIRRKSPGNPPS